MKEDDDEFIIENWNKELQKAIKIGKDAVNKVVDLPINKDHNLGFSLVEISENLLTKILTKEYKEYDRSSVDFQSYLTNQSEGSKEASILIRSIESFDNYKRPTIFDYIYAMYVNDLKV